MPQILFKSGEKLPPAQKVGCVSFVECAVCGYEPGGLLPPRQCPKCLGHETFHRVVVGGGALGSVYAPPPDRRWCIRPLTGAG